MPRDHSDDEEETIPYEIQYSGEEEKRSYLAKDGYAKATFPNEDVYEGNYEKGTRHGQGDYAWAKGGRYVGSYVSGVRSGVGSFSYPDGSLYVGEWNQGKRHGHGTYTYANGDKYCGTWDADIKQGVGTYLYLASQTMLTGTWLNGQCQNGTWSYFTNTTQSQTPTTTSSSGTGTGGKNSKKPTNGSGLFTAEITNGKVIKYVKDK